MHTVKGKNVAILVIETLVVFVPRHIVPDFPLGLVGQGVGERQGAPPTGRNYASTTTKHHIGWPTRLWDK